MAGAAKPTNEQIVEMLDRVLHELRELRKAQDQLTTDLRKVVQAGGG